MLGTKELCLAVTLHRPYCKPAGELTPVDQPALMLRPSIKDKRRLVLPILYAYDYDYKSQFIIYS
jgi:hypothetical protein